MFLFQTPALLPYYIASQEGSWSQGRGEGHEELLKVSSMVQGWTGHVDRFQFVGHPGQVFPNWSSLEMITLSLENQGWAPGCVAQQMAIARRPAKGGRVIGLFKRALFCLTC